MTQRERTMATLFGGAAVTGLGLLGIFLFYGAIQASQKNVENLRVQLEDLDKKLAKVHKDAPQLDRWRRMSLAASPETARAEYRAYLKDLIKSNGLFLDALPDQNVADIKSPIVFPGTYPGKTGKVPVYTGLNIFAKFKGTLPNLVSFMKEFQNKNWMHRIKLMTVERASNKPNEEQVAVQLTIEALIILDADKVKGTAKKSDRDLLAAMSGGPAAGLSLLRWPTWSLPVAPLNAPSQLREYSEMGYRNPFLGPRPPPQKGKDLPKIIVSDDFINMMRHTKFNQLTVDSDNKVEAMIYDAWNKLTYRLSGRGGQKTFPLVQTAQFVKIIQGTVYKIESYRDLKDGVDKTDIIFRVTLKAEDAKTNSSKWWRYALDEEFYKVHDEDVTSLVSSTKGKIKEDDKGNLYVVAKDYWAKLTRKGGDKVDLIDGGPGFRMHLDGSLGEVAFSDKDAVVLRLEAWPSGNPSAGPTIPYARFYPEPKEVYRVNTKHFNELLANKKVKAGDIERVYVVNNSGSGNQLGYWDELWNQRIVFPDGNTFRFYGDLLKGDIIHRNEQVVIIRLDEKYCHSKGDFELKIKDRWHEGFCLLQMDVNLQDALWVSPLPDSRLPEFLPKVTASAAKD